MKNEAKYSQASTGRVWDGEKGKFTDRKGETSKISTVTGKGMDKRLRGMIQFGNCRRWAWRKSK